MNTYEMWTLIIQVASVLMSTVIAVIAIWGDWIRHLITPPALILSLKNREGELTLHNRAGGKKARYYHLKVSNPRGWVPAKGVTVYLKQIDQSVHGNHWVKKYNMGQVPLLWQYGSYDKEPVVIGESRVCDLGYIEEGVGFAITLKWKPSEIDSVLRKDEKIRVRLIAIGENVTSNELVLELSWDGGWHEGSDMMMKHMKVDVVER